MPRARQHQVVRPFAGQLTLDLFATGRVERRDPICRGSEMLKSRSLWRVGVAAVALSSCSSYSMYAIREWWTEDLRDPPEREWREGDPSPYRAARDDAREEADEPSAAEIFEQDVPPPRNAPRAAKPKAPAARFVKSAPRVAVVQPPLMPAAPPSPGPSASARPLVPSSIVTVAGMTEADVRGALGSPHQEAQKGSQKIWIYRGNSCSVEVSFFLDVTRNTYAALDHKTRGADGATAMSGPCLQSGAVLQDLDR